MNESVSLITGYLSYFDALQDGEYMTGTTFIISDDIIYIYQMTDESEETGEGPDKYFIMREEVPPVLWSDFVTTIKQLAQNNQVTLC